MTRPLRPTDLSGADGPEPTSAQLTDALAAARQVESLLAAEDVHPSATFVDRVMGAIVVEPRPQPAIAAGYAARRGRFRALVGSLVDTWRVATTSGRPFAVRAQAAAFVLVAVMAFASVGGIAAVGAFQLLTTRSNESPPTEPTETASPTAEPTPEPSDSAEPTETAEPSDSAEPTETAEPTDKSGATPRPTATPTETPRATETPHESETPQPTETPHEGSDG